MLPAPAAPVVPAVVPLVPEVVDPDADDGEPLPIFAFARMNWPPLLALLLGVDDVADPAVDPLVPVAPVLLPLWRQPVSVTVELSLRLLCELLVVCAVATAPASTTAKHAPIHTCILMRSSSYPRRGRAMSTPSGQTA